MQFLDIVQITMILLAICCLILVLLTCFTRIQIRYKNRNFSMPFFLSALGCVLFLMWVLTMVKAFFISG